MVTINIVSVPPDWTMLFVDGEKVHENHSIDHSTVLKHIEGETLEDWSTEWRELDAVEINVDRYEDLPDGD